MNFNTFQTYNDSPQNAFETFCTQLFERCLRRKYGSNLVKFRVVNGAGGDGGIEAYGELANGDLIAVQAKWFRTSMQKSQIKQIEKSVNTAMTHRKKIVDYFICVPRALASEKMGKNQVPVANTEESRVDQFTAKIQRAYPKTTFTWWFEQDMQNELLESDNEGMNKFWFERDVITLRQLVQQFELEKAAWIDKRYIPELHGQGVIQSHIEQILYSQLYRKDLLGRIVKTTKLLQNITSLITRFSGTLEASNAMLPELESIRANIEHNLTAFLPMITAIQEGVSELPSITIQAMPVSSDIFIALEEWQPSALQLGLPRRLSELLDRVAQLDVQGTFDQIRDEMQQSGLLFLGNGGTGKTHALSNTVDIRLNLQKVPAMIIRAKGAPAEDWSALLKKALDIDNWSKNEMLSALETLAVRADYQAAKALNPGDELKNELTKVIICVDGLEEDTEHWPEWYERIRESIPLNKRYSRVIFAFTARPYFLNEAEMPTAGNFRIIEIPREGDVPVQEVVDRYFEHFDIAVEPKSLIRGIDTLYALRLFCNLYEGQKLTADDEILTAEHDLLNEKIDQMENEFRGVKNSSGARTPVRDAIEEIVEVFYAHAEITHPELFSRLKDVSLNYLDNTEIERVIEFLVNNAFLTKSEIPVGKGVMRKMQVSYTLTYQSIMEIIMAKKYVEGIVNKEIAAIPEHLWTIPERRGELSEKQLVNQRIVQEIVNTLFHDHDLLIGLDGFLAEGISAATIHQLQAKALIQAPQDVASSFRANIDALYFEDHKSRHFVFRNLIYPSAASSGNYFGAEYLHGLLMQQPTAVDRDKIWLGMDRYDIYELEEEGSQQYYRYDLHRVIDPDGGGELYLPELSLHNEYPLIFGWALATLDQSFRERLRTALTGWAIKQPQEFKLLLDKLFSCNDPQIQEDLAAITLGVASRLKNKAALKELADWALANVFEEPGSHPDIIVRTGFRSIIERAHYAGVINEKQVKRARPRHVEPMQFIQIDGDALEKGGEEIYPIVHDLAWYVIKRSFDDFLEYDSIDKETEPEDRGQEFLKAYLEHLDLEHLSVYSWAISAAIAYMKSLGFNRTEDNGNGFTDSSHGSKSKLFTLEEKYTWLAVHYIQGYLSDYLPLKDSQNFVMDYMQIVNIGNPAEFLEEIPHSEMPDLKDNWIIKEPLAPEMQETGTPDEQVKVAVECEPNIDFNNWIHFADKDLRSDGINKEWLALFNYTNVHDSKSFINSSVNIRGVLIDKGQAPELLARVKNNPSPSFVQSIDTMVSSPNTDTYSNPTDVVWMKWIGENYATEKYYLPAEGKEKTMHYAVTSVTKNTVENGENEIYIPSKIVRDILGISEMAQQLFLDDEGRIMAINHILSSPNYDRQEMTLVPKEEFLTKLEAEGKEIVWFVDLFRSKNALNKSIKSDEHPMKTRKYMVWYEKDKLYWEKFWDARFSNERDKDPNQREVNRED